MSTRVDFTLTINVAQPYSLVSCRVVEGLSELTHAVLQISSFEDLDLEEVLLDDAIVHVLFNGEERRRFTLKVGSIRFLGITQGAFRYEVDLRAHLWLLRFTDNTRKFRKMSARDIVSKILDEHGVTYAWRIVRETPRRNYCVQYHETNLDFIHRLLEFEGIYYTFDDEGTLVLADQSSASPDVEGQTHFELLDNAGALERRERGIFEMSRGASIASGKVTVNDFDWKKPHTDLLQAAEADRDGVLEVYDYPSGYRNVADGAYIAKIRLEALRVEAERVEGEGDVPFFAPARIMTFGAGVGDVFAGEYLLTHVEHSLSVPGYDDPGLAETAYENRFRAIEREVPFRPPMRAPRPTIAGHHTVMVRGPVGEEIHTDKHGRFRAQFHWDREAVGTDEDSRWLRILQESATSMVLARVGWEMSAGYIDGDPDRPIGIARHINGEMIPNYGQPANRSMMTIKTPTYPGKAGFNEWRLDDRAAAMTMDLRAERDLITKVLKDRSERVGSNVIHTCLAKYEHGVNRDQTVSVGSNSRTATNSAYSLTVSGSRAVTVGGSETIEVGQEQVAQVQGDETEDVGSVRLTISGGLSLRLPSATDLAGGMKQNALGSGAPGQWLSPGTFGSQGSATSMLAGPVAPPSLSSVMATPEGLGAQLKSQAPTSVADAVAAASGGSIDRTAQTDMTRTVGGGYVALALENVDLLSGKAFAETIGGLKMTLAQTGDIGQTVGGPLIVTVGGAVIRKSEKDMSYSANKTLIRVGGFSELSSADRVELRGDFIEIEASNEIKISSGGLEIALTPGVTRMKGEIKLDAKSKIVVTGAPDNLT